MQIEQLMVSAFMLINPSETINYTAIANDIIDFETEIASVSRTKMKISPAPHNMYYRFMILMGIFFRDF